MQREHRQRAVLAFVAAVTWYCLVAAFAGAASGGEHLGQVVVFGLGAGFGLEFLWSVWPALWRPGIGRAME